MPSEQTPARFIAFDVRSIDDVLLELPQQERREPGGARRPPRRPDADHDTVEP
jgi:hypothetical protein